MAKKKSRYPNRKRNAILGAVAAVLVIAVIATVMRINYLNTAFIFSLDNKRVSVRDYEILLLSQRANLESQYGQEIWGQYMSEDQTVYDAIRKEMLEELIVLKVVNSKAKELGVTATAEDKEHAKQQALELSAIADVNFWNSIGVQQKHLEKLALETIIADKMIDVVAKDYVLDEEEFETAFQDYVANKRVEYMNVDVQHIQVEDWDAAMNAQARLNNGENFDALREELSLDYDATAEDPMAAVQLRGLGVSEAEMARALDMAEGTIAGFTENANGYVTYRIVSVYGDSPEEIESMKEIARANYIANDKYAIFQAQSLAWADEAKATSYKLYQKVYDKTEIPGLLRSNYVSDIPLVEVVPEGEGEAPIEIDMGGEESDDNVTVGGEDVAGDGADGGEDTADDGTDDGGEGAAVSEEPEATE